MKLRLAMIATVPTVALAQVPEFTPAKRADGQRQVEAAGKMLADKLRDPASARFRNIFLFKTIGKDGMEHVSFCGQVNAQNGYGGMTGFQNFTAVGTRLLTGSTGILNADMVCNGQTPRVHDTRDYAPELRTAFDSNAGQ